MSGRNEANSLSEVELYHLALDFEEDGDSYIVFYLSSGIEEEVKHLLEPSVKSKFGLIT
jgi:hypothetical protein